MKEVGSWCEANQREGIKSLSLNESQTNIYINLNSGSLKTHAEVRRTTSADVAPRLSRRAKQ
jgi:hypothetical protein